MWTYRVDDADCDPLTTDNKMVFPNSDTIVKKFTTEKAHGTVYVIIAPNGQDWAWTPVQTDSQLISAYCKMQRVNVST